MTLTSVCSLHHSISWEAYKIIIWENKVVKVSKLYFKCFDVLSQNVFESLFVVDLQLKEQPKITLYVYTNTKDPDSITFSPIQLVQIQFSTQ